MCIIHTLSYAPKWCFITEHLDEQDTHDWSQGVHNTQVHSPIVAMKFQKMYWDQEYIPYKLYHVRGIFGGLAKHVNIAKLNVQPFRL